MSEFNRPGPEVGSQAEHENKEKKSFVPEAYLDDVDGRRIIARISGTNDYVMLIPPDYEVEEPQGSWLKESAIAKHGFKSFEEEQPEIADLSELRGIDSDEDISS